MAFVSTVEPINASPPTHDYFLSLGRFFGGITLICERVMLFASLAVGGIFFGCQANSFLLELITTNGSDVYFGLTCAQYTVVSFFSLPLVLRTRRRGEGAGKIWRRWPFCWRRGRLSQKHILTLAFMAWVMSVSNNFVFSLLVTVPLHSSFRTLALLWNMLAGYLFLGKRYTLQQVLCVGVICAGLIALTVEKANRSGDGAKEQPAQLSPTEFFKWLGGLSLLVCTTACATSLGIFQEYMYTAARRLDAQRVSFVVVDDAPPLWAEALAFSHLYALPLFMLLPGRLCLELSRMYTHCAQSVLLNCFSQFLCITSVFLLSDIASAFTLVLLLTLRKLATFTFSVVYFQHYRYFCGVEWVAMVGALLAGAVYPLLRKAPPVTTLPATANLKSE